MRVFAFLVQIVAISVIALVYVTAPLNAERATVIVAFEPYKANGRKWDSGRGADPVICLTHGCYKSRGRVRDAKYYRGRKIFLPAVINRHCRNSLRCVFRGVDLNKGLTEIWPVDLDGFKHDHLQHRYIKADRTCLTRDKRLQCLNGIFTEYYSMWVIPEYVVEYAGEHKLNQALFHGLDKSKDAYMSSFLVRAREHMPRLISRFYFLLLGHDIPQKCARDIDVIYDAFHISGLLAKQNRHIKRLFKSFIEYKSQKTFTQLVHTHPKIFWDFHDLLQEMHALAGANDRYRDQYVTGVKLRTKDGILELLVSNWAEARAQETIEQCVYDTAYARQRDGLK